MDSLSGLDAAAVAMDESGGARERRRLRSGAGKDAGSVFDLDEWLLAGAIVFVVTSRIIPLAGLIIEILVVLVATAWALAGKLLFRRPWSIKIGRGATELARERVVGWDASRRRMAEIAAEVAAGGGDDLVARIGRIESENRTD